VRTLAALHAARVPDRPVAVRSHSSVPPESLTEDDLEFIDDDDESSEPPPVVAKRGPRAEPAPTVAAEPRAAPQQMSVPVTDTLRKALVDAEAFRALELYPKAAATLRRALGSAPHSLELRAALQQVLLDMGDRDGAIDQMLSVAQHYADRGSLTAAESELYQVLELSPDHPAAVALLDQVEALSKGRRRSPQRSSPKAAAAGRKGDETSTPAPGEHEAFELVRASTPAGSDDELEEVSDDERLPAYELQEDDLIPVIPTAAPVPTGTAKVAAVAKAPAAKVPAAKALPAAPAESDTPLPQFSLDSGLHAAPEAPAARKDAGRAAPARAPELRSEPIASQPPSSHRESIRAALDEAQFFSSRGLYQDASLILLDRLEQYPNDPELVAAIEELEPKLNAESGTRDVGLLSGGAGPNAHGFDDEEDTTASPIPPPEDFEPVVPARGGKSKELVVQFSTDGNTKAGPIIDADAELDLVQSLEEPKQEQIDVDEVFAKFKQGVKAQVSDSDSATHYDLGVAYKEMGLLADAAREFELASRDAKRECNCLAMMGMMYRERGELDRAAEAYVRGLSAQHKTVAQEVSLYYDLGVVYEMKNDADEAIYYFQRITRRDPTYRDVSQRLASLLPRSRRFSQPARAINDDQEFDRSFDDLYKPE
jgi:tetratricopeptide (TPR) repeat protein